MWKHMDFCLFVFCKLSKSRIIWLVAKNLQFYATWIKIKLQFTKTIVPHQHWIWSLYYYVQFWGSWFLGADNLLIWTGKGWVLRIQGRGTEAIKLKQRFNNLGQLRGFLHHGGRRWRFVLYSSIEQKLDHRVEIEEGQVWALYLWECFNTWSYY